MTDAELDERLKGALCIAQMAADFLLSHEDMRFSVADKGENDYVTVADKKSEELIKAEVMKRFPRDGWYGEESGMEGDEKRRWIVDPIDGTVDFMWSFPLYTVSIAFEDEDGIALGVVIIPRQKEVFYAKRGSGAFHNGERLELSENLEAEKSLVLLVPPHRVHDKLDSYIVRMRRFYDHFSDVRSIGSAACSLCYVASGRCSAYYEEYLQLYDIAAGWLILTEAGGMVGIKDNGTSLSIAASHEKVYNLVLELIDDKGSYI